jgi:hypothetical protein
MAEQSQPPQHVGSEPAAPPAGVAWSQAMSAALFDPESWRESLEAYAHTTNLAVALVDVDGRLQGSCQNPQPTWRQLHAAPRAAGEGCPFALAPPRLCTCVRDALARRTLVLVHDRAGLVHFAVPLVLDDAPVGALLAGQVFDQYSEQLRLEYLATRVGLSPQEIWQVARLELPVKEGTVRVYGRLLAALGRALLHTRYHILMDAQRLAALEQRFQERTAALYHEVAERKEAEAQVHQAHAQLRALMARLESLREAERTRLARDLHDDLGQQLTGLNMNLAWMAQQLGTLRRSRTVTALLDRVIDAEASYRPCSAACTTSPWTCARQCWTALASVQHCPRRRSVFRRVRPLPPPCACRTPSCRSPPTLPPRCSASSRSVSPTWRAMPARRRSRPR